MHWALAGLVAGAVVVGLAARATRKRSQAWFWTPEWQAGEREADRDIAEGRTTFFEDEDAFAKALMRRPGPSDPGGLPHVPAA